MGRRDLALLKVQRTTTEEMSILSTWLEKFHLNNWYTQWELKVNISGMRLSCQRAPIDFGVMHNDCAPMQRHDTNCTDPSLCWNQHPSIENVHPCTRVCTSGMLCPGVMQKRTHSSSHHNRVFAHCSGWSATSTGWSHPNSFEAGMDNSGGRPCDTRRHEQFHPPKEAYATSPYHWPCSTTIVVCLSTRYS